MTAKAHRRLERYNRHPQILGPRAYLDTNGRLRAEDVPPRRMRALETAQESGLPSLEGLSRTDAILALMVYVLGQLGDDFDKKLEGVKADVQRADDSNSGKGTEVKMLELNNAQRKYNTTFDLTKQVLDELNKTERTAVNWE
ncbi:MAG: hypothetical protein RIT81_17685 [Deltaproteobacteria bacterium]